MEEFNMSSKEKNDEKVVLVKVKLECGRHIQYGYAADGCGKCDSNTNNAGQAVCCC